MKPSPRWCFMQGYQITQNQRPYLDRLRLVGTPWFGVMLHRIHTPDQDHDPHDHPWWFASLVLSGRYWERVWDNPANRSVSYVRNRSRFSLRTVQLSQAHRITDVEGVLWTLVVTGPRHESWRFWTEDGPVDWHDYPNAGDP